MPRISLGSVGWILLLGFLGYRMAPQVQAAFGVGVGGPSAPNFEVRTIDGKLVSLEKYRGQVVLVNFWATWCLPCRAEMPGFQRVYEDRSEEGFVVLGFSTDRAGEGVVRDFLAERDITFPVAMATGGVVQDFGGVQTLPTSFLIDHQGRVRQQVKGFFAEPTLRMAVPHLLEEAASTAATEGSAR